MQLATRKLSPLARRERISHARALAAPMTRIPMTADPNLMAIETLAADRAALERRACQYAACLAGRERGAFEARRYNAWFDGSATVYFSDCREGGDVFAVTIPAHVLAFAPNAPAIALPAPDGEPRCEQPRCEHTAPMALEPPTSDRAPAAKLALPAPIGRKLAKPACGPRQPAQMSARELTESRAMRAARIAALPVGVRRQIGAR